MSDEPELTLEQRIRERAYKLWNADGQQQNMHGVYWHRASVEIEAEIVAEQDAVIDKARDAKR